jgi:hypothetical protein
MSSSQHFSVGTIGAGTLAQAIADHAVAAGHHVIFSNSRGPEPLEPLAARFGANASAGTVAEAARADIVILAVGWEQVPAAVKDVPDWNGRIVIDATNQWQDFSRGIAADLGDQTGSERNAALMPGARVVKAFNALYGRITAQNLRPPMAASSPSTARRASGTASAAAPDSIMSAIASATSRARSEYSPRPRYGCCRRSRRNPVDQPPDFGHPRISHVLIQPHTATASAMHGSWRLPGP